jgi:DnaJ like chaperone protein
MGTILGGLIGHLFDRASEERKAVRGFVRRGSIPSEDRISAAQLNFLTSLIGLSIAVADADRHVRASQINTLKSFFKENFPYAEEDHRLIQSIIDETFKNRRGLDVDGLCGYYRSTSTLSGRLLLLRLLFKIAVADQDGINPSEEKLIQDISQRLGVDGYSNRSIRAEFIKKVNQAYEVLGVSPNANNDEIRSAYRKLAAQFHPDTVANLGEEFVRVAEEKFKVINRAYDEVRSERGF